MSKYLDPTGQPTFGIGICARCSQKFFLADLFPDPNDPGLRVCKADRDQFDPYRLPPRRPDQIVSAFCEARHKHRHAPSRSEFKKQGMSLLSREDGDNYLEIN